MVNDQSKGLNAIHGLVPTLHSREHSKQNICRIFELIDTVRL